jgi:hypothetical protein
MQEWPKLGDKLQFTGETFAFHNNVVRNARKLLLGQEYTVRAVEVASSWCLIKLMEFPETNVFGDDWFSLSFFEWPNKGLKPPMTPEN